MAFWNKKKKDEEESARPSSSADSAPSSRVANALRNILNATAEGQRKAAQADRAVAQAGQKKLADAAQNLYAAAARGQQAATRADQAVAGAQTRRVQEAAQGIYSAVQQQQERAARDQMAAQQRRMQAPTRRAQDAAAGLYSAVLLQQQSGMPMIQAPTPRAADAASALRSITAPRRQNSEPAERDDGILANLFRQQEDTQSNGPTADITRRADRRQGTLMGGDPNRGVGAYADILHRKDYAENSRAGESKSSILPWQNDVRYDYINDINDARQTQDMLARTEGGDSYGKYQLMTDDEIGIYNYLYATQGRGAADEYLDKLEPELNQQWFTGASRMVSEQANKSGASQALYSAGTALAMPVRTAMSAMAIGEDVARSLAGKEIDPYSDLRMASQMNRAIREGIGEEIKKSPGIMGTVINDNARQLAEQARTQWAMQHPDGRINPFENAGDMDEATTGDAAAFLYQSVMSAMDSAVNSGIAAGAAGLTGASGTALQKMTNEIASLAMSSEVMSTSIADSKLKGYSNAGALSLGFIRAAIEYWTERLGGEWVIKNVQANPLNLAKTMLLNMVPEGIEEVESDAANGAVNLIVDYLFGTKESGIPQLMEYYSGESWKKEQPVMLDILRFFGQEDNPRLAATLAILGEEGLSFLGGALATVGSSAAQSGNNMASIDATASRLNTTRENVVDLMNRYDTENPGAIEFLANAVDANSVDEFTEKMNEFKTAQDALDDIMKREGKAEERARRNTEQIEKTIPSRTVVPYADNTTRNQMQDELHERMVEEGNVIDLTDSMQGMEEFYPDLRRMPKKERNPILRQRITELKDTLFRYLTSLKGINFDFDINGTTLEARLYNTGIEEVMKNITKEKAGMLSTSEQIFRSAEYLYSTEDKRGSADVEAWDYFYVPVKIGDNVVGVRIAVRSLANRGTREPAQIYNWGIKKDATLGGDGRLPNGSISTGASSDASIQSMNSSDINIPQSAENINSENSEREISPDQLEGEPVTRHATVEESMTMDQAKRMIDIAFNEYRRDGGEFRSAEDWAKNGDIDDVTMYLENSENVVEQYLNKIPTLYDDFDGEDIVEAYRDGTLRGKEKQKPSRMDTSVDTGRQDDRFYAPRVVQSSSEMWDAANQRVTNENREDVYKARKDILFFAHQPGAAEELGLTQKELNAKLRSWSNYSTNGRQVSQRINQNVAAENQWTGIQNCSAVSKATVTDADIESMVKAVNGESDDYRRNYVGRTMLALDTHIDWSGLTVNFIPGYVEDMNHAVRGDYNDSRKEINVGNNGDANTVAHEMGHALDAQWGREIFGGGFLSDKPNTDKLTDPKAKQFADNFRLFVESLQENSDIRSNYTARNREVFARFIAKFVEWTDRIAGNNFYRETSYYGDKFTQSQFVEFARLLQEKSALEATTENAQLTGEVGETTAEIAPAGDIRRQLADAEREYMEHSDANDAEYDYRAQLDKINDLRRQIEEAESVNAEADNVNAETDTNPTIEAMEREGRVSRGTYDVEKYGDTHPERGEVGRDGVRMCNTTADLEAELNEIGGARIRNDTGEYFARIRRKNDNGYLLTINRDGKRDTSRSFADYKEASAYAASYIEGQTQARTDADLDAEKSAPVRRQEPIEALTTGQVQDEAKRQKQNKAAEMSTQSLRDRIRKTDEEIKALRRLEKTTGLTETQAKHKADLQETLEILNDELTSRKGRAKAKKEKVEVKGNRPVRSAAEAKNRLMEIFHTAPGQRADTNTKLEAKLAEIVSSGKITEQNREDILDMLIDAGMVRQEAEQEFRDVRDWLRGSRIYVSEHDRADFGDDWEGIRKAAWANGIYLTSNESDRSVDSLVSELAETFGTNMFPTDDAPSDMVRNLIEQAEKGRSQMITFAEAVNNEARMEHVDPQEIWNDLSRQTDETLRAFAEKAKLEMDLKDRTASMLATERKRAEDRMERMAQRRRESEIREKTMKAIKRLARLRGKAAPEVRTQIDEALKDIDTQARQLTINGLEDLQELARVYEDAKKAAGYESEENPGNFISNPYIEQRLARLTQKHINDMDIDDVIELGRLVSALENTVKTNGKMIGEQFDSEVKTVADKVNAEVQSSRGAKPGFLQKWFAEEQLSPRRFLELLGGWKKGAMAELADSLEKGQTKMLDFQRRAAQLMDPFMSKKENRKWLKTASGKNAKWFTYSVANGMAMDGSGITGQTIEITPMMKVSLYLASLNEDNLRHIQTGGLRIPDKALYIKGKTQEAFAQGQIVKMQPQAVRAIASSLTQEEKTFAGYLQKFFDNQSKNAINEVSMQLDGFERAGVDNYFPIESDRSFIKSDVSGEARAQTVEGIGSISNDRVHAGNPIRLDDAYNVFMRQVTNVSRYYGYAIPIRNFQAVNNYVFHEEGNAFAGSIKDTINRKWGAGAENYITKMLADIQGASSKGDMTSRFLSMLRGNLAGATLAVNPSVAVSQTASYPGAAQAVGWDGLAAGLVSGPVDEKLIEKYTPLLWYRSQGYSTQEIGDAVSAQNKSLAQKALASKTLNWIQTMDRLAVKRIWKAAEYRVTKDTGLKPGSKALIDSGMDPYYQKVAEVFNRAVYDTQPNYTDMERAQILRSDSDLTKFLTMYKTVPLQYYGMTVEAVGRMQSALKSGNKTEIRAARKYAADTFGGLLAANSVYVVMKALFKSFRGKDKDYRDEEGEITPESYFKQLGKDLAETYAGSIIGGAEAYSLITGWINGDKFRAPEINVLSSVEDIANGFQSIFKAIDDDDPGKTAKAVKDAAENIAMVCGLPVKNVETYLMAAIRYIQPQTAMQYDSFFGGLSKGDLKGMDADTIGSAASIIMNSRTGANMERAATDELSRLYAAGFTDAIPTAIPDSFEYAGNTVKIKDRGAYRETWGGTVGDNLEELTANESYINADDKTKEAMIRKLYQYATVQARMGADPEYTVEGNSTYGWTEKADAAMESGMDLPTVIAAMTTMNAMTADKVNGQTVKSKKTKVVEYIDGLKLDTEQKDALYELAGYESGLEKAPWHSGISAEAGYTAETNKPVINEAARKRAVEANYQQLTSSAAYKAADDQTKKAMIEKLNQYAEVQGMVTTNPDYLPTGTAGWTIWAETAEKAGIDLISAIDYATQLDSFKADYNEYGKAISGSKKDKVTKYIDALDLTNEQKDILYLKIYAENSLKYTPWHGYTGKKKKRRGGGRRGSGKKSTAAKKPVSVGKITPKYNTGIDVSALFPSASTARKNGKGNKTLAADLAEIVNSGLDISELFGLPTTGTKAPKGRTKVDFEI